MDKAIDLSLDSDTEQHCSPTSPPSSEIIDVDERTGDCGSSASGKRPCASVGTSEKKGNKRAKADGKGKGKCKDERKTRSPLFRLISTSHDGPGAGTVSMEDLLSGDFTELLLANFMIDIAFLLDAQPRLASVPVVIVHGFEKGSEPAERLRNVALKINLGIKVHTPEVPNFGKHHGKLMLIKFATGIRVIVTTANFIEYDTVGKSQGVWYQDFPRRQAEACEFEGSGAEDENEGHESGKPVSRSDKRECCRGFRRCGQTDEACRERFEKNRPQYREKLGWEGIAGSRFAPNGGSIGGRA